MSSLRFLQPPRYILTQTRDPRGLLIVAGIQGRRRLEDASAVMRAVVRLRRPRMGTQPEERIRLPLKIPKDGRPLRQRRLFLPLAGLEQGAAGTSLDLIARVELVHRGVIQDRSVLDIRIPIISGTNEVTGAVDGECLVCRSALDAEVIQCSRCATPHHRECWDYAGGCATYACVQN